LEKLKQYDGIIVPGGFGTSGVEGKISAIKYARENNIPYLGLCYGMQLAVIEYARNVCGITGAHTREHSNNIEHPIIDIIAEQKQTLADSNYGGTMRLGSYPAKLKEGSKVREMYGDDIVYERHRHRYEVNPDYIDQLEQRGLVFSGRSPDRRLMEFMELPNHPFFVATQSHPEFTSRPTKPNPLFLGFIKACSLNE